MCVPFSLSLGSVTYTEYVECGSIVPSDDIQQSMVRLQAQCEDSEGLFRLYRAQTIALKARVRVLEEIMRRAGLTPPQDGTSEHDVTEELRRCIENDMRSLDARVSGGDTKGDSDMTTERPLKRVRTDYHM